MKIRGSEGIAQFFEDGKFLDLVLIILLYLKKLLLEHVPFLR
jgi:hypothetical protein